MKTKFVKVSVEERLPEKDNNYFCTVKNGEMIMTCHNKLFSNYKGITHWFEEIPDKEVEINEKLKHVELYLNEFHNDLAKSIIDMHIYSPLSSQILEIKKLIQ